ncbi:hypothetical protein DAPPUDRAFT_115619 [Daphnia pulex]|uniref:Uncharacterized protein n=1 Tax=Daphnia pulex TaxID=6669 RepID=E9HM05_DAPPU|nr:hypothetical protein DAPPUDRAFT_115619 [Daphnia pulex]|eukprot:EFX67232.1 hypothetical protein DAPPUDRAFT_115619 [Daphnia pulex]
MCEDATVLKKTFSLTAQRKKGMIVLLDVQAKIRKILATIISDDEEQMKIQQTSVIYQASKSRRRRRFRKRKRHDQPADQAADQPADPHHRPYISNDEDDEDDEDDMQSDTTEVNPDVPNAVPLTTETNDVAQTPQPPTKELPHPAPTERIPSPSPSCYYPPKHFQNMYAPPIMLQSEGEYDSQREKLIQQYLRDSLD